MASKDILEELVVVCARLARVPPETVDTKKELLTLAIDSVRVVELSCFIRERWGVQLDFQDFYHDPTLSGLAGAIETNIAKKNLGGQP